MKFSPKTLKKAERMVVVSTCLFVALLAAAGFWVGWEDVQEPLHRLTPTLMAGLLGLSLVNYALRGARWAVFAQRLDVHLPLGRLALYYTAGFALVTTPGKVGTALRLWLMQQSHKVPYVRSAPMLFMDNITDFLAMLMLALIGGGSVAGHGATLGVLGLLVGGLALFFAFPQRWMAWLRLVHLKLGQPKPTLFDALMGLVEHLQKLFSPMVLGSTVALSTLGWLAECVAFYWLLDVLGHSLPLTTAMFIFAFATLVGALSMLPGGLGSAEAVMLGLLLAVEVPMPVALAATAIIRFTTLWFAVILGFLVLPVALKIARR